MIWNFRKFSKKTENTTQNREKKPEKQKQEKNSNLVISSLTNLSIVAFPISKLFSSSSKAATVRFSLSLCSTKPSALRSSLESLFSAFSFAFLASFRSSAYRTDLALCRLITAPLRLISISFSRRRVSYEWMLLMAFCFWDRAEKRDSLFSNFLVSIFFRSLVRVSRAMSSFFIFFCFDENNLKYRSKSYYC